MKATAKKTRKAPETPMNAKELRRRAKRLIDGFEQRESLQSALKFLEFLEDQEQEAATREIEENPALVKAIEQGLKDIAAGRTVNWRKVRNDV